MKRAWVALGPEGRAPYKVMAEELGRAARATKAGDCKRAARRAEERRAAVEGPTGGAAGDSEEPQKGCTVESPGIRVT